MMTGEDLMLHKRLISLALVLVTLLGLQLALVASTSAAVHSVVPYSFTLTPEQCPDLDTTISGSGEYFIRTNTRVDKNGVTHINENNTTNGTATDTEGNTYRYNYHNNSRVTIPPGEFPFTIMVTDHFNLVGAGNAQSLHVGFNIFLTFSAPGEPPTVEEISVRGMPECDPI
jgi:hypothetical protein